MKMISKMIVVPILAAAMQLHAQTITNMGYGSAGNGATAEVKPYNISITDDGKYITINGNYWIIFPYVAGSPFTQILRWDTVKNKPVPFGIIKAKSTDGKKFMAGIVLIRTAPTMKVVFFKSVAYYTPATMPTVSVNKLIVAYVYSPARGIYEIHPELDIPYWAVNGAIWYDNNLHVVSAVLDGPGTFNTGVTIYVAPVPAPGGIGGTDLPIMPARVW